MYAHVLDTHTVFRAMRGRVPGLYSLGRLSVTTYSSGHRTAGEMDKPELISRRITRVCGF